MTPTKRKRLYLECEMPKPGDMILLKGVNEFRTSANVFQSHHIRKTKMNELALVMGLNKWLDWMLVLSSAGTLGWLVVEETGEVVT